MLKGIKKKTQVKGSALFSSILVLITTLLFIKMYQDIYQSSMENNILLIKYLSNKWLFLHLILPFFKILKVMEGY